MGASKSQGTYTKELRLQQAALERSDGLSDSDVHGNPKPKTAEGFIKPFTFRST